MSYQMFSIKDAVNYIECGRMFLSEKYKKFVWKEEQIENLFNSLFIGYPIGALVFWKTSKRVINDNNETLLLYEFIRNYHINDNKNVKVSLPITTDYESYYIVFDGQQRFSSLYIAIKGSFAYEDSSKKELYLNLFTGLANKNQDDGGYERFKFLTEEEANSEQNKWFKVKNILKFEDEFDVIKFALHKYKNDKAGKNLCALFKILTSKENSPLCSYVLEERISIDGKQYK